MPKLKFLKKLLLGTLAISSFGVVGMFLSADTAYAAWSCPGGSTPPANWGIHDGEEAHGMAGLSVRVRDVYGNPLDGVVYQLRSDVPGMSGNIVTENGEVVNVDDRIFKWPAPGSNSFSGRTSAKTFRSNEEVYLKNEQGANLEGSPHRCAGWSVLGPGRAGVKNVVSPGGGIGPAYIEQWGNEWALDCAQPDRPDDTDNLPEYTDFWISSISIPSGDDGKWGGRWEVITPKRIGSGGGTNSKFLDTGSNKFNVTNGESRQVTLVWHPNPPPPPGGGGVVGRCENLTVNGWGAYDTHNTNGNPRWRDTRTYVRVTDGNGKVIVPEPGDNKSGDGQFAILNGGPGPPGYNESKTWHYKNKLKTKHINIHIIRKWHKRNGPNYFWEVGPNNINTYNCFEASCNLGMLGNVAGRANGVRSRSNFTISANVTNNASNPQAADRLYATIDNRPLTLAITSGAGKDNYFNPAAPNGLPRGWTSSQAWNVNEPGWNIGSYGVNAKLYYDFDPTPGVQVGDLVLADCAPTSYDVYKPFSIDTGAQVSLNPTLEDPTSATFKGFANTSFYDPYYPNGFNVGYTTDPNRQLYPSASVDHLDGGPKNGTGRVQTPYTFSMDPRPNQAGDKYCLSFNVHQDEGLIGPNNSFAEEFDSKPGATHCLTVHDQPYVRAYHTDVLAGGAFEGEGDCSSGGFITSYVNGSGSNYRGSGVQFAALAINAINGFTSASVRSSGQPAMPTGLTFANTTGGLGGNFGGVNCVPNFFDSTQDNPRPVGTRLNTFFLPNGQSRANGNVTLSGGTLYSKKALYVDGNVYITSDITLGGGGSDVEDLPNFSLIVRGNIYISRNVKRLDGLYVAQSRPGVTNSSRIYTCAPGFSTYSDSQLWDNCGGPQAENPSGSLQLVVNGAFIADQVHLTRIHKSLRNSSVREGYSGNAAEVFRLSPDTYLSIPAFKQTEGGGIGPADSIKVLPPIL